MAKAYTADDVRAALAKVNEKHGMDKCRAVLAEFAHERISEVAVAEYAAFVARCEALVA